MAYCTISDVEAKGTLHGKPYSDSPSSVPTASQVNDRITFRAAEIDARLSIVGVTVPVDPRVSPLAAALLRDLNATGAAGDAQQITYFRSNPSKSESAATLLDQYERQLNRIAGDNTRKIPGDPRLLQDAILSNEAPERMTQRVPWSTNMRTSTPTRPRREFWLE